jgi:phosphatidylglycerol---prolipoprotein diacylglyceryl transferase
VIPVLFRIPDWVPLIGSQAITSFGVMLFVALLAGGRLFSHGFATRGLDKSFAWELVVVAAVTGLVGAKLYYLLLHSHTLRDAAWRALGARGGLVWYGGLIAGAVGVTWVARAKKLPLRQVADAAAPALALGYALGRIGCFLVGDDYGLPTTSALGIAFPHGLPPTTLENLDAYFGIPVAKSLRGSMAYVRVHPTQLYEAAGSLILLALLLYIAHSPTRPIAHSPTRPLAASGRWWTGREGQLFIIWLLASSTMRFLVEFMRAKDDRIAGPLTVAQLLSLALIGAAIALHARWS